MNELVNAIEALTREVRALRQDLRPELSRVADLEQKQLLAKQMETAASGFLTSLQHQPKPRSNNGTTRKTRP